MWTTFGHQNQKFFLENALKNRKFAHAYLFCGPNKIGKKTLALEFANKILGLNGNEKAFNPDLLFLSSDQYKIEEIRNLISDLSLKPYQHEYKVAVLDDAENLNEESANALLKTFEEASPTTIIILVTQNRQQLLPTIVSRAQVLNFNRLSNEDFAEAPKEIKELIADQRVSKIINGKIGKAFQFATDRASLESEIESNKNLEILKSKDQSQRLLAIKKYSEMESEDLAKIFENWLDYEHANFILFEPQKFKNIQSLVSSLSGLRQNFNKKMVLEKLFLSF
jgi:DNA polymerase-3 subunit delta'